MTTAPALATPAARASRRPRLVLWVAIAVGVAVGALVVVLALVGSPPATTRLLGRPAPAISGPSLGGGPTVALRDYAGKWVLVDFSASWCVTCREEMPQLLAFGRTAARHDATVLTVEETPSDAGAFARYLASEGAHWPAVQDPLANVTYGITGIPTMFLVDPDGIVVGYFPSGISPKSLDGLITAAIKADAS